MQKSERGDSSERMQRETVLSKKKKAAIKRETISIYIKLKHYLRKY